TAGVDPQGRILNLVGPSFSGPVPAGQIDNTPLPFNSLIDGLPVIKMGRTSCLTSGRIDAFDAMGKVVYPTGMCNVVAGGTAFFNHQILVFGEALGNVGSSSCSFAETGDSGALVVTATDFSCPQAVGIVFAGTPSAGTPYGPDIASTIVAVNPIGAVLNKFGA